MRYDRPMSAPPSPTTSRSSTQHNFSEDDDDTESDSDRENKEVANINSSTSEKSFNQFLERAKSTENVFKNMNIKGEKN